MRCKELLLLNFGPHCEQALLPGLACDAFYCHFHFVNAPKQLLDWSAVAGRPGIFMVSLFEGADLAVSGCAGSLPFSEPGWALVLEHHGLPGAVEGLPTHLFSPGPEECLVWRTSAVTNASIERIYDLLGDCV